MKIKLTVEEMLTIRDIRYMRSKNNDVWVRLLEIAAENAPEETVQILEQISNNDAEVVALTERLCRSLRKHLCGKLPD